MCLKVSDSSNTGSSLSRQTTHRSTYSTTSMTVYRDQDSDMDSDFDDDDEDTAAAYKPRASVMFDDDFVDENIDPCPPNLGDYEPTYGNDMDTSSYSEQTNTAPVPPVNHTFKEQPALINKEESFPSLLKETSSSLVKEPTTEPKLSKLSSLYEDKSFELEANSLSSLSLGDGIGSTESIDDLYDTAYKGSTDDLDIDPDLALKNAARVKVRNYSFDETFQPSYLHHHMSTYISQTGLSGRVMNHINLYLLLFNMYVLYFVLYQQKEDTDMSETDGPSLFSSMASPQLRHHQEGQTNDSCVQCEADGCVVS